MFLLEEMLEYNIEYMMSTWEYIGYNVHCMYMPGISYLLVFDVIAVGDAKVQYGNHDGVQKSTWG